MIRTRRRVSEGILRKALVIGAAAASFVLTGCSGGGTQAPPVGGGAESSSPPPSSQSARSAPAKSLGLSDPCAILTAAQRQSLGIDQRPEPEESNGKPGCGFAAGEAGSSDGWTGFVAADPRRTMKQFASSGSGAHEIELAGYPTAQVNNSSGCMLAIDVSDSGSLFINLIVRPGSPMESQACDKAAKIAEAAVQNLPNA
ncbi:DUF3558 domain-containing protein [Saccharopolyspora sp. NPDC000995]